jgi:hypothetical protein
MTPYDPANAVAPSYYRGIQQMLPQMRLVQILGGRRRTLGAASFRMPCEATVECTVEKVFTPIPGMPPQMIGVQAFTSALEELGITDLNNPDRAIACCIMRGEGDDLIFQFGTATDAD